MAHCLQYVLLQLEAICSRNTSMSIPMKKHRSISTTFAS
jgi:hypothetical protein